MYEFKLPLATLLPPVRLCVIRFANIRTLGRHARSLNVITSNLLSKLDKRGGSSAELSEDFKPSAFALTVVARFCVQHFRLFSTFSFAESHAFGVSA